MFSTTPRIMDFLAAASHARSAVYTFTPRSKNTPSNALSIMSSNLVAFSTTPLAVLPLRTSTIPSFKKGSGTGHSANPARLTGNPTALNASVKSSALNSCTLYRPAPPLMPSRKKLYHLYSSAPTSPLGPFVKTPIFTASGKAFCS